MNSTKVGPRTVVTLIIVGVLLIVGGFLISQATPLIFPVEASAEARQIDQLFRIALLIGGAIFLLVQGLLAYSVWRFRARAGDLSDGPNIHGNTTLEIVWTAIPAVIVVVLTVLSYSVWTSIQSVKPDEQAVEVQGARFNWAFTYSTPDPRDSSKTLSFKSTELHTYIGRPVRLEMRTQDVIHSFWVPAMRIKQDVIPGRVTEYRFTPVEAAGETYPARYPIQCAELCGAEHGNMIAWVVVHQTEDDYTAWFNQEVDKVLNPPADPVVRGEGILASQVYPCHTCHVLNTETLQWAGNVGPALNGVGDRAAGPRSTATGLSAADYLYQSIHEPNAYLAPGFGPLMPQLNIPECETRSIVAYLCTLTSSGQPACTVELPPECGAGAPPEATPEATAEGTPESSFDPSAPPSGEGASNPTPEATAPAADVTAEATAAP
ncbi:MAG: cytochrome c oxidase subunit II [Chloroflexi bacterium]|nr:cytochrome c oxidase subunit II [Chloroflexota bacterium]